MRSNAVAPAPTIEAIRAPQAVDPRFVGGLALSGEVASTRDEFGIFAEARPAGFLDVPNYLGAPGERLQVPSIEVVTHRNAQGESQRARIVDLHGAHPEVAKMYEDVAGSSKGMRERLTDMAFATTQRLLGNSAGANGLHHIRGTRIADGGTVFYSVNKGAHVYVARLGTVAERGGDPMPVLAVVGATNGPRSEHAFWRIIGSASYDSKRRHTA